MAIEGDPRPIEGSVIYAIKHESFFEAIDLSALLDQPGVFAKEELFRIPVWGPLGKIYGLVPVARRRGASTLRKMLAAAARLTGEGRPLAIFPEGTRVPHGTHAPLQSGFAGLYKMLKLPVIPVSVDSGPLYHRRWKRSGTLTYRFGEPIPPGLPREEIEARVLAAINAPS
ncbi:lysophospholipid acyltransferase family protein [Tsuneonella mangrovi]|uniref:lysophospholipid acyltransferase family protein n=1 Tax=Tsuneonella mangrovi TaxID=1982042 RepID=UPI0030B80F40